MHVWNDNIWTKILGWWIFQICIKNYHFYFDEVCNFFLKEGMYKFSKRECRYKRFFQCLFSVYKKDFFLLIFQCFKILCTIDVFQKFICTKCFKNMYKLQSKNMCKSFSFSKFQCTKSEVLDNRWIH